jgi:hypothetical protein
MALFKRWWKRRISISGITKVARLAAIPQGRAAASCFHVVHQVIT